MKLNKKSQANTWIYFVTGLFIIAIAIIQQPTLRSQFGIGNHLLWQSLVTKVTQNHPTIVQEIWMFRDFYSRGTLHLQKQQEITIPHEISSVIRLPETLTPYLFFESPKIKSIEGSLNNAEAILFSQEVVNQPNWELLAQSDSVIILESQTNNTALIIGIFDLETAQTANGYLYFDLQKKSFKESMNNKRWLVISLVSL